MAGPGEGRRRSSRGELLAPPELGPEFALRLGWACLIAAAVSLPLLLALALFSRSGPSPILDGQLAPVAGVLLLVAGLAVAALAGGTVAGRAVRARLLAREAELRRRDALLSGILAHSP